MKNQVAPFFTRDAVKRLRAVMVSLWSKIAGCLSACMLLLASTGCTPSLHDVGTRSALSVGAQTRTLALSAPKAGRVRPLVVVIADNAGTETTDFVIPYPRHRPRKFSVLRCASSESEA